MESVKNGRMVEDLHVRLLGELELSAGGELLPLPNSKKTRALLGYLIVTGREHTRSRLCDLLWDGPADPRAALRWSLSKLRPLVDGATPRIRADREHVAFEPIGVTADLIEVRRALAPGTEALAANVLEECRAQFRGELLEGLEMEDCFGYAHWLAGEREKARNMHVQLLANLTTRLIDNPARVLEHARAWVALEPLDEGAHVRLIEILVRLGRVEEARRAARGCARVLERELGRAPGERVAAALSSRPPGPITTRVAPPPPASARPRPARDLGLFGRAEECARIERILDRLRDPAPARVLWFSGEAGIGKSRLLAELLERARKRGATTLSGKAYEAEATRPLAIWSEVLGGWSDLEQSTGRARQFELVRERLRALGPGPVVVALDDLQWVDVASAALVSWLSREAGPGVLFAAAVRPGEFEDNPAARRLERALVREERLDRIDLEALDEPESRALVRSIDPEVDAHRLFELSGGNPLYAIEMARMGNSVLSPRLQACLSDRLDRLNGLEREFLRAGAAMGGRFSLELIADVTGLPIGELLRAARSLELAGMLRPAGSDEYDFAHDLIRQAACAEQSDPARRLLHRRIARRLAQDLRSDEELAPDLARQASLAGEHQLAARACVKAGERCLRLYAHEEATNFARRGLEHAPMLAGAEGRRLTADLLALEVHAGLGRRSQQALQARLSGLAQVARRDGEHGTARKALYLLSILDEEAGEFVRAEARTLQAVDEGRGAGSATEVEALANTGRCLAQLERELTRAERFLREAQERSENTDAVVDINWGLGLLAWHRGRLEEAHHRLVEAAAAARERGNHWAAFECLSRLVFVDLAADRPHRALEYEERLRVGARRLAGGSEGALVEALMALARDTLEASVETRGAFERTLAELRSQDSKAVLAAVLNQAAELELKRGAGKDIERARARAQEALAAARVVGRERQIARACRILQLADRTRPTNPKED